MVQIREKVADLDTDPRKSRGCCGPADRKWKWVWPPFSPYLLPVSYTHLDVYKRQRMFLFLLMFWILLKVRHCLLYTSKETAHYKLYIYIMFKHTNIVAILICELTFTDVWTEAPRDINWRKKQVLRRGYYTWRRIFLVGGEVSSSSFSMLMRRRIR